jgi:serine/threonine-protein kinase
MKPERWKQIEGLYDAALKLEASRRAAFLDQACADDEELR